MEMSTITRIKVGNRHIAIKKYYEFTLLAKDIIEYLSSVPHSTIEIKEIRKLITKKTNYGGHLESGYCVISILESMEGIKHYLKGQKKYLYYGKEKKFNRTGKEII